jgi:methionyl-tRNA formyltransferase
MKIRVKKNMPTKTNNKIAFWGTPELTLTILDAMEASGILPAVIITRPDRPVGRGLVMTPPAPKIWGEKRNIPVLQPEKIDVAFTETLLSYGIELSVVVAYGKILPESIIQAPHYGTLNVHYSLLPRFRGATPVESAILAGDTETGVCIQQMVYKLDAGAIHAQEKVTIGEHETAPDLRARLNIIGARLLIETINALFAGTASPVAQDETLAIRCGKIEKKDGEIDPLGDAVTNDRKFRAYSGWPGTYFFIQKEGVPTRVIVKEAQLENHTFVIKRVVPEGKKEINYSDLLLNL